MYVHFVELKYRTYGDLEVDIHICLYVRTTNGVFPTTSGAVLPTTSGVLQKCKGVRNNMCEKLYSLDNV